MATNRLDEFSQAYAQREARLYHMARRNAMAQVRALDFGTPHERRRIVSQLMMAFSAGYDAGRRGEAEIPRG